jgi:uncharacterized membrane protein
MDQQAHNIAKTIFHDDWEQLTPHEREVIEGVLARIDIPRNANDEFIDRRTFGQRVADRIATFGGSWPFILIFLSALLLWALINSELLGKEAAFDPYPYIFLNLVLSMLAAVQAPIIMMSQNRQNSRDRLEAEIDHEVNVRAELAIHSVLERLDSLESQLRQISESQLANKS